MKKISMRDIAKELNVSTTTVSFVVNGKHKAMGISDETAQRVNELIGEKGYNPNTTARTLRTGKSNTIALIVEDISNSFFASIAKGIETEAHKNNYKIFYGSTDNNNEIADALFTSMKNSAVDGFIITPTKGMAEQIKKLKKEHIPFILIDRLIPDIETDYVILDNYQGAYDLTQHLIDNGYRKIGFVTLSDGMSQMENRKKGFFSALQDAQIDTLEKTILEVSYQDTDEFIIQALQKYLQNNKNLDALFFATNYLGISGLEAIQKNNLTIPNDIAVVSFDDHVLFRLTVPSITVAAQPIEEIATKSIELLLKNINKGKKQLKPVGIIVKPEIIIRNSSAKKVI
jgi:LacI family transcriptional regulator